MHLHFRRVIDITALAILGTSFSVSGLTEKTQSSGADQPHNLKIRRVIEGKYNPELVPEYLAWKSFFGTIDSLYRDIGDGAVLSPIWSAELSSLHPTVLEAVKKELLDTSTIAMREYIRLTNEHVEQGENLRKAGASQKQIGRFSREFEKEKFVPLILNQRNSLRERLEKIAPHDIGIIWSRVTAAVEDAKQGMQICEEVEDDFDGLREFEREVDARFPAERKIRR